VQNYSEISEETSEKRHQWFFYLSYWARLVSTQIIKNKS